MSRNTEKSDNPYREFLQLLMKHRYLEPPSNGEAATSYNSKVSRAVSIFQDEAGLPVSGTFDFATLEKLRSWQGKNAQGEDSVNSSKSKYMLGSREIVRGVGGDDVMEFSGLLIKAGYLEPKALKKYMIFSNAHEDAIRQFQHNQKLKETGVGDLATIRALQDYVKAK